jgi:2-haloacid dehalogenase
MVEDPQVLVFDVNETLLDMSPLRTYFARVFGSPEPLGEWFVRLLHGSLVANHTNRYRPFGTIGGEALTVLGKRRGIPISQELAAELDANLRDLPPHPDVASALTRLAGAGFRLVTLTNGSSEMAVSQLTNAGLDKWFERTLTVESVGRFKPAAEIYAHAVTEIGVAAGQAIMVAAHDWDVIGARAVGMEGAFVEREGSVWSLPDPPPPIVVSHLGELADVLEARRS